MVKSNNNILKMWAFFVVLWLGASTAGSVENNGTTWAILVAGSKGWDNYRHQADVCHAYQILKKGGLKDENIIVFMYDDIACNSKNPRPGIVINRPNGTDVYFGVPKDYTGDDVNVENFLAVVLGEKQKLKGVSGKVCRSNSHDRVFIYYADHGRPGYLGMPTGRELQANELIKSLDAKHKARGYKEMVKDRTSSSHVMEYGNKSMGGEYLYLYQGFDSDFGNNQNQGVAAHEERASALR